MQLYSIRTYCRTHAASSSGRKYTAVRRVDAHIKTGLAVFLVAALFALTPVGLDPAGAAPKINAKTVYYTVQGSNPTAMLSYMLRNGPRGNHGRALGTTNARISQTTRLLPKANRCQIREYRLDVDITVNLPRLAKGQKLSAPARKGWNGFAVYVRHHENRHKSMFIACARRIDKRVRALSRNQSCRAIQAKIQTIFNQENKRCDQQNQAYDRRETKRIDKLPFIRQATGTPRFTRTRTTATRSTSGPKRLER